MGNVSRITGASAVPAVSLKDYTKKEQAELKAKYDGTINSKLNKISFVRTCASIENGRRLKLKRDRMRLFARQTRSGPRTPSVVVGTKLDGRTKARARVLRAGFQAFRDGYAEAMSRRNTASKSSGDRLEITAKSLQTGRASLRHVSGPVAGAGTTASPVRRPAGEAEWLSVEALLYGNDPIPA